jgi:hypothetical protein
LYRGLFGEGVRGRPDAWKLAEIHWYEAHGIGKKELKFKRPLRVR